MILFINDIKVRLKKIASSKLLEKADHVFETKNIKIIPLEGNIVFQKLSEESIVQLLEQLEILKKHRIKSITLIVKSPKLTLERILISYKLIEAAGGIVRKKDKALMIFRLGKWDFPKGKLEEGETIEEAAVREVEEECNIKAELGKLIKVVYHTYRTRNKGRKVLKRTYWYEMGLISDKKMKPQLEEDITDIQWVGMDAVNNNLDNSYQSLKYLFKKYTKK